MVELEFLRAGQTQVPFSSILLKSMFISPVGFNGKLSLLDLFFLFRGLKANGYFKPAFGDPSCIVLCAM